MAWDKTKPASGTTGMSSEIRTNWEAIEYALHGVNLLADPTYLIWPEGDDADPAHWTSSGTGATIARETTTVKIGGTAAQLTYGSATAYLDQDILPTADYDDGFDGEDFSCGAWVYSDSGDATIGLEDGSGNESGNYSSAHTGDSSWEWLTATFTVDSSATKITYRNKLAASGDMYVCWPTVVRGPIPPACPLWPRVVRGAFAPTLPGDPVSTGTELWAGTLSRPFIVQDVQIECLSDVAGQAMILDVNHYAGDATGEGWQSMFTTKPQVAVAARSGGAQPDGTYQYRCFKGGFGTTIDNARIGIDCDQAATSGGKSPAVFVRFLAFARPQEILLSYNAVK